MKHVLIALTILLTLILSACGDDSTPEPTVTPQPPTATAEPSPSPESEGPDSEEPDKDEENLGTLDVVETLRAAGNFTTLVSAIEQADLVEKLTIGGPYTIFAPTDAAFASLPADLLSDEDALFDILLYHVVEGAFVSTEMSEVDSLTSLLGDELTFELSGGTVVVNDAAVITEADVEASNGMVHVIDQVLLLPDTSVASVLRSAGVTNLFETVTAESELSTLVDGLAAAGLLEQMQNEGPYTIFAPTDDAFLDLVDAASAELIFRLDNDPAPFLLYHVLPGRMTTADLRDGMELDTLQGDIIAFELDGSGVHVNGARLVTTDVRASNGIIHIIDRVILPPDHITSVANRP